MLPTEERVKRWFKFSLWRELSELPGYHGGYKEKSMVEGYRKARCPECNGEIRRWAHFNSFYPGVITFQCSGGHFLEFNHGLVFRAISLEKVYASYLETK